MIFYDVLVIGFSIIFLIVVVIIGVRLSVGLFRIPKDDKEAFEKHISKCMLFAIAVYLLSYFDGSCSSDEPIKQPSNQWKRVSDAAALSHTISINQTRYRK